MSEPEMRRKIAATFAAKLDQTTSGYFDGLSYRNDGDRDRLREGLRKAGLTE